jgi:hypothetical protein
LKDIFTKKVNLEILTLNFSPRTILFEGDENKNRNLMIKTSSLELYGSIRDEFDPDNSPEHFSINLALKHFLGFIKISQMLHVNLKMVLERISENDAFVFLTA